MSQGKMWVIIFYIYSWFVIDCYITAEDSYSASASGNRSTTNDIRRIHHQI